MSEREPSVFSSSREEGQEYSLENQLGAELGRLSTAQPSVHHVLQEFWDVARSAEGLSDEERGIVGLAVMTYLASEPTTPPELDPEHDVLDAVQARNAIGFPGSSSLWWAVTEGRLRPYQERVTPSGRTIRTFTRAEVDRYLTEYGPPRSAR